MRLLRLIFDLQAKGVPVFQITDEAPRDYTRDNYAANYAAGTHIIDVLKGAVGGVSSIADETAGTRRDSSVYSRSRSSKVNRKGSLEESIARRTSEASRPSCRGDKYSKQGEEQDLEHDLEHIIEKTVNEITIPRGQDGGHTGVLWKAFKKARSYELHKRNISKKWDWGRFFGTIANCNMHDVSNSKVTRKQYKRFLKDPVLEPLMDLCCVAYGEQRNELIDVLVEDLDNGADPNSPTTSTHGMFLRNGSYQSGNDAGQESHSRDKMLEDNFRTYGAICNCGDIIHPDKISSGIPPPQCTRCGRRGEYEPKYCR